MKRLIVGANAALVICLVWACGGSGTSNLGPGGSGGGSGLGSGSGTPGSFGGGDAGDVACSQAGQTQACWTGDPSLRNMAGCHDGTQTCAQSSNGEITKLTWGPCTGEQTNCGPGTGTGGGGSEDGGKGSGGGGSEEGGGGNGGGGKEEAGGGGQGGGGGEIDAGPVPSCNSVLNNEPDILVQYEPSNGGTVTSGGQIKVWVQDECAPTVAPGTQLDPNTGAITAVGTPTALAPDGYPWEPVLYVNGTAYVPTTIKGSVTVAPPPLDRSNCLGGGSGIISGPPTDPVSASIIPGYYTAEDIWDVTSLGLSPGTYNAEFVIHDGDVNRAIACVTIVIGP